MYNSAYFGSEYFANPYFGFISDAEGFIFAAVYGVGTLTGALDNIGFVLGISSEGGISRGGQLFRLIENGGPFVVDTGDTNPI